MIRRLILASASPTRLSLLRRAGLEVEAMAPRIDEEAVRAALEGEGAPPRDIADALAEMKARKIGERHSDALVIGCDQVLDLDGTAHGKPASRDAARDQLCALRGRAHRLHSAVVIHEGPRPVWRHVGTATLAMRDFSDGWLEGYLTRNWDSIRDSAGCYRVEEEGIRLFRRIEGDHFTVLGLPLLPLLDYLGERGQITT